MFASFWVKNGLEGVRLEKAHLGSYYISQVRDDISLGMIRVNGVEEK